MEGLLEYLKSILGELPKKPISYELPKDGKKYFCKEEIKVDKPIRYVSEEAEEEAKIQLDRIRDRSAAIMRAGVAIAIISVFWLFSKSNTPMDAFLKLNAFIALMYTAIVFSYSACVERGYRKGRYVKRRPVLYRKIVMEDGECGARHICIYIVASYITILISVAILIHQLLIGGIIMKLLSNYEHISLIAAGITAAPYILLVVIFKMLKLDPRIVVDMFY